MKTKKTFSITIQVLLLVLINYELLIDSGFIYKDHWSFSIVLCLIYLQLANFLLICYCLYTPGFERAHQKFHANTLGLVTCSFLAMLLFRNTMYSTQHLALFYLLGLFFLFACVLLVPDVLRSYKAAHPLVQSRN